MQRRTVNEKKNEIQARSRDAPPPCLSAHYCISRKKRGEQKKKRDKKKKKVEKLKKKNLGANDDAPPPCSSGVKKLIVRVGVRAGAGVMSYGYEYLEIYIIVRA